jgi:hypothetical protein
MFFCPTCGGDREFARRAVPARRLVRRRPARGSDAVVCARCGTEHSPLVLLEPTNATLAEAVALALRHGVVAVLRADPRPSPDPRLAAAVAAVAPLGGPGLGTDAIAAGLECFDPSHLHPICTRAGRVLLPEGRRELLWSCVQAACVDGPPTPGQRIAVRRVGAALGCADQEVDRLLAWAARTA